MIKKNICLGIILILPVLLPVLLQAQYAGGNGRGDVSVESFNIPLSDGGNNNKKFSESCSLQQNYPNPFNPATHIRFSVAALKHVKIVVHDSMGREIQTLVDESIKPGTYSVQFDGSSLKNGIYFYTLSAGDYSETRRMVLQK